MKKSHLVAAVTSIALTGFLSSCASEEKGTNEMNKEHDKYIEYRPDVDNIPVLYGAQPPELSNNRSNK